MGVMLRLDLDWSNQCQYLQGKISKYQHLIQHKHLHTRDRIVIANMVTNAYVAYSMGVVPYTNDWLKEMQGITLRSLKKSMHIPINMDDEPFFMSIQSSGHGLVSLIDLNTATTCAHVYHLMNSDTLGGDVTTTNWNHAKVRQVQSTHLWLHSLDTLKLVAWPKLWDLNLIGHLVNSPKLAKMLLHSSIYKWSQLLVEGELVNHAHLGAIIGRPFTTAEDELLT
jgi:hypothetical protein